VAEFGHESGFRMIWHRNEAAARAAYPLYQPMSTTTVAFHKLAYGDSDKTPTLLVERHGSLSFGSLAAIAERCGFRLALAPRAAKRLTLRDYPSEARTRAIA
jgi:hypothetical protein